MSKRWLMTWRLSSGRGNLGSDIWRNFVIRKYVRARSAAEAIKLSVKEPVVEVNEMKEKPETSNPEVGSVTAIGFSHGFDLEENEL